MHYLLCLEVHFHLLLGVVVVLKHVDMRNHIVGKLMGKAFHMRFFT